MRGTHNGYAKISYVTTGEQSYNSLCSPQERATIIMQPPRICPQCSRLVSGHRRRRFCNDRCRQAWHRAEAREALGLLREAEQAGVRGLVANGHEAGGGRDDNSK